MTHAVNNSIYADSAQARASDKCEGPKGYGRSILLSDEEISARHALKVERDAEEARRSRARVRGALAQIEEFFGSRPAPKLTTPNLETGANCAPRPDHENRKSIAA